ncbi:S-layer homology domain-containing protein [Anaerotignum sp.]
MKKRGMKRILSVLLSLVMVLGLMPVTAHAEYGDDGNITTAYNSYKFEIDHDFDATVMVYTTPDACSIDVLQGGDVKIFSLEYDKSKWHFVGWRTWFKSLTVDKKNPNFNIGGTYYFSEKDNPDTAYNGTDEEIQVNKEYLYGGTFYLHAIFKPIVTVNAGDGVSYAFSGVTALGNNKYGATYGNSATVNYNITDSKYVVSSTAVNGTTFSEQNNTITLGAIKSPVTVSISTRLKQMTVTFDGNGENVMGTMAQQNAKYGDTLAANGYTRKGYYFTGWNTAKDGTGTPYADKAVLQPATDGDSITLYAQWAEMQHVTYTAPTAKTELVYDGSAQELVSAGSAENGTMEYSLDGTNWSTTLPVAVDAGEYTVWYKVEGDLGYYDVEQQQILASIGKADPNVSIGGNVTATGVYGDKLNELTVSGLTANGAGTWNLVGTDILDAGTYDEYTGKVTYTAKNYESVTVDVTAKIEIARAEGFIDIKFPAATAITYGDALSKAKLIGGSTEYGSFAWEDATIVPESVTDDKHTVVFTPNEKTLQNYDYDFAQNPVKKVIEVSIEKAAPIGRPVYTPIREEGKTLTDAALTTVGGTFSVSGSVKWEDPIDTVVEQGKAYTWVFTPVDSTNYKTLQGEIVPWVYASSGGGGGSSTSVKVKGDTVTVDTSSSSISEKDANKAIDKAAENDADEIVIDTNKTKVTIPEGMAEKIADETDADLVVETKNGKVVIPNRILEDLDAEGKVSIEVTKDKVIISDEDGELSDIGKVEVTVPYKENSKTGNVAVEVTKGDGTTEVIENVYNGKDSITFNVDGSVTFEIIDDYVPLADIPVIPEQPAEKPADNPFFDVSEKDWFYPAVMYVSENGLMSGMDAENFGPYWNTTRGMITTILWRMEGKPEAGTVPFKDVKTDAYYADAVAWAAEKGIVSGYDAMTFGPDDNITREQLASILWRYAKYKGYDVSVGEDTNILSYKDAFSISEYAIPAMQWACGEGIISGNADGTLNPRGNAQRAHAAQMLMKFMDNVK